MYERYLRLYPGLIEVAALPNDSGKALTRLLLNPGEHAEIVELMREKKNGENGEKINVPWLHGCRQLTLWLQEESNDVNLSAVRYAFDKFMKDNGDLNVEHWLGNVGKLFPNPVFDSGVMKVINGEALTAAEVDVLEPFQTIDVAAESEEEVDDQDMYFTRPAKKQKVQGINVYPGKLEWIPPTSNVVERLFSLARLSLDDTQKSMSPMHLEGLVYLKLNKDL